MRRDTRKDRTGEAQLPSAVTVSSLLPSLYAQRPSLLQRMRRRHSVSISWAERALATEEIPRNIPHGSFHSLLIQRHLFLLSLSLPTYGYICSATYRERPRETCTYPCHALESWPVSCKGTVSGRETLALRKEYKTESLLSKQNKTSRRTNVMTTGRKKEG